MPINNNLPDKEFPFTVHTGEPPITQHLNALDALHVELIDAPTREQVLEYIPRFSLATWEDSPRNDYTMAEREQCLKDLFNFKLLPGAMETMGFTFLVSNIDLVDVTHLIRHRAMTFSAHCTGDRDQRHDAALVKPSIWDNEVYSGRLGYVLQEAKRLYADMVDNGISILDARTVLPRCLTNHYYARVNLKDFIPYLNQRLDRQIQPESDNLIAMKMLVEVAKIFPEIANCIDLDKPDYFFIKTAQQDHSSNMYLPEEKNDIFEWKPQWFIHNKTRADMPGGSWFTDLNWDLVRVYKKLTEDQ
jgi:thymidylate synthase (FAD)